MEKICKMTDYFPLSSEFLESKKECCGNGCIMCPYDPPHIKGTITKQLIYEGEIMALAHMNGAKIHHYLFNGQEVIEFKKESFVAFCKELIKIAKDKNERI